MNIGFIATRLAGVDGVSLETAKLVHVLQQHGHHCFYIAGEIGDENDALGYEVPTMHFMDTEAQKIHDEAFNIIPPQPDLLKRIFASADGIRNKLESFIEENNIDVIIPQNASTIPMNISLGVAIADLLKRNPVKAVCHHHDFYWERDRFINNVIQDLLDDAFPPRRENAQHLVISTLMQRRLYASRGIEAHYLPNVFDFDNPPPEPDEVALTFRSEFGLSNDDLIVLQPTRIIRRKGIEKAIELIRKLNDDRLVFVVTGYEHDEYGEYGSWLREEAERAGIRHLFIGDRVGAKRDEKDGKTVFSLWDIYPQAHFVTYPSTYEGFGNAFIETMYFRKPAVVHTYPVYKADIQSVGVQAVEFFHDITQETLTATHQLIDNANTRDAMTEHNYQMGLKHFSYQQIEKTLSRVMAL